MSKWELIIAHLPATIFALAAFITALINRKQGKELHVTINSRMDALMEAEKKVSFAEGMVHQKSRGATG